MAIFSSLFMGSSQHIYWNCETLMVSHKITKLLKQLKCVAVQFPGSTSTGQWVWSLFSEILLHSRSSRWNFTIGKFYQNSMKYYKFPDSKQLTWYPGTWHLLAFHLLSFPRLLISSKGQVVWAEGTERIWREFSSNNLVKSIMFTPYRTMCGHRKTERQAVTP